MRPPRTPLEKPTPVPTEPPPRSCAYSRPPRISGGIGGDCVGSLGQELRLVTVRVPHDFRVALPPPRIPRCTLAGGNPGNHGSQGLTPNIPRENDRVEPCATSCARSAAFRVVHYLGNLEDHGPQGQLGEPWGTGAPRSAGADCTLAGGNLGKLLSQGLTPTIPRENDRWEPCES
jgi:hypothetical protein